MSPKALGAVILATNASAPTRTTNGAHIIPPRSDTTGSRLSPGLGPTSATKAAASKEATTSAPEAHR